MLMSTQANRFAHLLLDARARSQLLPPLSAQAELSLPDAYDVVECMIDMRVAQGEVFVGRKIGFANRRLWPQFRVSEPIAQPIWAPLFDQTVRYAVDNRGLQSLDGAVQPRLTPQIVFRMSCTPEPDAGLASLADCIEWMAHGFEVVTCPFPDWKFEIADAVAAFGLHGTLIVGEPRSLSAASRRSLGDVLADSCVSLSCADEIRAAGFGSDLLGSPLHALLQLHQQLAAQTQFPQLAAGEIVSTGSWTPLCPIQAGEVWTSAFSGVSLPGLTVSFV